jgi:predicted RNA binding protein YcfA (HicA-like mRNA interferase family)
VVGLVRQWRLLSRITSAQNNVRLSDLVRLVEALGFTHDRTAGSHRVYIQTCTRPRS